MRELLALFDNLRPGTPIPKPQSNNIFRVHGWGKRKGRVALIYDIPNTCVPSKPHQKGITKDEWAASCQRLLDTGRFSRRWFHKHLDRCAAAGSTNIWTAAPLRATATTPPSAG